MSSLMLRGVFLLILLGLVPDAPARNIDLASVPERTEVQLTIYNAEDLTLVRETRILAFAKGQNPLQFSWANTLIDPTSVELRFLDHSGQLMLQDTTFPHDKPQMLFWNVESQADLTAKIEIGYFISGIHWTADYTALANPDETALRLEGFVRVDNQSGEDYPDAQVRLVIGSIHLVEKIAQLARIPVTQLEGLERTQRQELKKRALRQVMEKDEMAMGSVMAMSPPAPAVALERPKEIEKQGLSEYFIYTIEGTETIPNGWAKRLKSFAAPRVPLAVQYRYRVAEYGDQLVRLYLAKNDKPSGLGATPLPEGSLQALRENPSGGMRFLAVLPLKYVPIGDNLELNLGEDPEVVFKERHLATRRDELWMRYTQGNLYRKVGEGDMRLDLDSSVAGWNEHQVWGQRIHNFTGRLIEVEIRRAYGGDVVFTSELNPKLHDFQTVEYLTRVKPGEKAERRYEITQKQGYNQKQNRVQLQTGRVHP
ncbi:MAG: hypothetical protein WCP34_04250 [Pseudomonadota bacterium]